MMDREAILRRLRGLDAKSVGSGCSEAEALAATDMLSRLLDRYGFSRGDLKVEERAEISRDAFFSPDKKLGNLRWVTVALETFCDVKIWYSNRAAADGSVTQTAEILGREPDVLVAKYLLNCFHTAMQSEWSAYQLGEGAIRVGGSLRWKVGEKHRTTFERGMMGRISNRLQSMKIARNARVDEETGRTGKELVVAKAAEIEEAFAKTKIKLRAGRKNKTRLTDAGVYRAGAEAGDRVHIVRGITHHGAGKVVAAIAST